MNDDYTTTADDYTDDFDPVVGGTTTTTTSDATAAASSSSSSYIVDGDDGHDFSDGEFSDLSPWQIRRQYAEWKFRAISRAAARLETRADVVRSPLGPEISTQTLDRLEMEQAATAEIGTVGGSVQQWPVYLGEYFATCTEPPATALQQQPPPLPLNMQLRRRRQKLDHHRDDHRERLYADPHRVNSPCSDTMFTPEDALEYTVEHRLRTLYASMPESNRDYLKVNKGTSSSSSSSSSSATTQNIKVEDGQWLLRVSAESPLFPPVPIAAGGDNVVDAGGGGEQGPPPPPPHRDRGHAASLHYRTRYPIILNTRRDATWQRRRRNCHEFQWKAFKLCAETLWGHLFPGGGGGMLGANVCIVGGSLVAAVIGVPAYAAATRRGRARYFCGAESDGGNVKMAVKATDGGAAGTGTRGAGAGAGAGRRVWSSSALSSPFAGSDINLCLYGLSREEASAKIDAIERKLIGTTATGASASTNNYMRVTTQNHTILMGAWPHRSVQISHRLYASPAEIILGMDLDCCAMAYRCGGGREGSADYDVKEDAAGIINKKNIKHVQDDDCLFMAPRAVRALRTRCNVVNSSDEYRSHSIESRLILYAARGFAIAIPHLDWKHIDPRSTLPWWWSQSSRTFAPSGLQKLLTMTAGTSASSYCVTDPPLFPTDIFASLSTVAEIIKGAASASATSPSPPPPREQHATTTTTTLLADDTWTSVSAIRAEAKRAVAAAWACGHSPFDDGVPWKPYGPSVTFGALRRYVCEVRHLVEERWKNRGAATHDCPWSAAPNLLLHNFQIHQAVGGHGHGNTWSSSFRASPFFLCDRPARQKVGKLQQISDNDDDGGEDTHEYVTSSKKLQQTPQPPPTNWYFCKL